MAYKFWFFIISWKTLVDISAKTYEINVKKYSDVLDYLNRQIDITVHDKDKSKAKHKYHKFMKWLREVPVVGFNSAKYDPNIMKMYLSGSLTKYDKHTWLVIQIDTFS
jgi:hypothetical protein